MAIRKNIQQILDELYAVDSTLQSKEKELVSIIDSFLKTRIDIVPDSHFKAQLKQKVMNHIHNLPSHQNPSSFFSNIKILASVLSGGLAMYGMFVFFGTNVTLPDSKNYTKPQSEDTQSVGTVGNTDIPQSNHITSNTISDIISENPVVEQANIANVSSPGTNTEKSDSSAGSERMSDKPHQKDTPITQVSLPSQPNGLRKTPKTAPQTTPQVKKQSSLDSTLVSKIGNTSSVSDNSSSDSLALIDPVNDEPMISSDSDVSQVPANQGEISNQDTIDQQPVTPTLLDIAPASMMKMGNILEPQYSFEGDIPDISNITSYSANFEEEHEKYEEDHQYETQYDTGSQSTYIFKKEYTPSSEIDAIPSHEAVLSLIQTSLKKMGYSLKNYGHPKIISGVSGPEVVTVLYPLFVKDTAVVDELGNDYGVTVSWDIASKSIISAGPIDTPFHLKSLQKISLKKEDIVPYISKTGLGVQKVSTPEIVYVRQIEDGKILFVPALLFSVLDTGGFMIVPLVGK